MGILGRRDVELNMFAQASILKKGVEGVLAGQASILKKGGGGGAGRSCENSSNNRWTKMMLAQAHSLLYQPVCPFVGLLFRGFVHVHTRFPGAVLNFTFCLTFLWPLRLLLALGNEISRIG